MDIDLEKDKSTSKSLIAPNTRNLMIIMLFLSDMISIYIAGFFAIAARLLMGDPWKFELFWQVTPVMFVCLVVFAIRDLYPGVGLGPVGELKRIITSVSAVVLGLAAMTFFTRNPEDYSRLTLALTWGASLVMIPFGRAITRLVGDRFNFWGEPVAIIGKGEKSDELISYLKRNRKFGLRPVVLVDGHQDYDGDVQIPLTALKYETLTENGSIPKYINSALVILPEVDQSIIQAIVNQQLGSFSRVILVTELDHVTKLGVTTFDLDGILGLEVHQNLLSRSAQLQKRIMDLGVSIIGLLAISPILFIIALLIKLTSRGPILYMHERIGQGGKKFKIFKFRTMYLNADQLLEKYLADSPKMRSEWQAEQKIKKDPRITPIGRILRKLSLDELPQFWNVIRGEMSVVGPRPIVDDEILKYAEAYDVYKRVKTGITGLWQVSGRNNLPYEERVRLDEYYVRNWSIWLDIYIMARTIWVVIGREGAF